MSDSNTFDYPRYLASREWALKKRQVRERSSGLCEHCHFRAAVDTHHLSYARLGDEALTDLQHLCRPCHRFESGLSDFDPAACDCDPLKAWEWVDLLAGEPTPVYAAALQHARDVSDAYR